jgi:glycosyltransferase involved in cell wall biosynthesis
MCVYNGERYLTTTIDSLLGQTMENFILDISDNGSTDRTEEICRSYAARDRRVRYVRQDENRGVTWNFNFVARASLDTEFFKWCAHDDVYESTYLEQCVAELDDRPEVVACHSRTRYINEQGDEIMRSFRQQDFTDDRPWVRFNQILLRTHDYSYVFAVIRRSVFARIRPFQAVNASDTVLLAELAFHGPFAELPDHLFANRIHPTRSMAMVTGGSDARMWAEWYGGSGDFALWHTWSEFRRNISASPLEPRAKARCYAVMAKWMRIRWKGFSWELAVDGSRSAQGHITGVRHKRADR